MSTVRREMTYDPVKRAIDIVLGGAGLLLSAPVQILVAAVVLVVHGRPVLFRQPRPGLNGEVFELAKFRTMRQPDRTHVSDAERLTRTGRWLRSTSLDELPSLWNVVRGDMSLVGPRPLLVAYLERYSPEQARRHEVRPGVTGLAQISGRNALSWDDRLALDVEYVERRNLRLDVAIVARTFVAVLRRQGINGEGEATMSEFVGAGAGERPRAIA